MKASNATLRPLRAICAVALAALAGCLTPQEVDGELRSEFDRMPDPAPTVKTLHATAHVMAAQGRQEECELVLNRLIAEHPGFRPAYNELAELYMRQDRFDTAMAALRAGLEVAPDDPVLLNNLGMCHFLRKETETALELFTRAAAAAPEDARSRANMCAALGLLGRIDEALALYYQILPPAEAHYDVAVLCEAIGDHARAAVEFARSDELRAKREEPPFAR